MNLNKLDRDVSNATRIQGTNDNSILSKCSMIKYGYFNDQFLPHMVGKFSRRAPLINRGYYIRAKAIDFLLQDFIEFYENKKIQIVSLGAGFDTSFFRLSNEGKLDNCVFVEIDYFDVAQRKVNLMQKEPALWGCLQEPVSLEKDNYIIVNAANYKLLGIDLTKLDVMDACIRASRVSYDIPTLFLSECVITYISPKKAFHLLKFIAKSFAENTFILYEQIHPDDSFGRFMCHHFQQLGSSLRGISKYKTKADQIKRFLDAGWEYANGCDMSEFYYDVVNSVEKTRVEKLEVFDEYEEWLQKCCHYMVLVATKGMNWTPKIASNLVVMLSEDVGRSTKQLCCYNYKSDKTELVSKGGVKTHYARSALVYSASGNQCLVRVSGYGQNPFSNGHYRLASISILDIATKTMTHIEPENCDLLMNFLCGSMSKVSNNFFILFGGRSSPLKPNNLASKLYISYNEVTGSWTAQCQELAFVNSQLTPSPRWRHAAGVYWIHKKPFLLVYGGRNSNPSPLSDTHMLNIDESKWLTSPSTYSSPGPLCSASVVSLGSEHSCANESLEQCCGCCCVLLFGGLQSNDLVPSSDIWRWCGRQHTWSRVTVDSGLVPRFSHTAHLLRQTNDCGARSVRFLSLGGVSHRVPVCSLSIISVDLVANRATFIDYAIQDINQLECVMFFNHSSALSDSTRDRRLWLVGGGGNCFSFGTQLNENIYYMDIDEVEV